MSKQYSINKTSMVKACSHILKHSKSDCFGILLGSNNPVSGITVTDVVPLFHDRVFSSTLECAFTMIGCLYAGQDNKQIVGVYDAPLKFKSGEAYPMSSLCTSVCEQIRTQQNVNDVLVLSLRVPAKFADESDEDDST